MTVKVTHEFKVCQCCIVMLANDESCDCSPESHPDGLAEFRGVPLSVNIVPGTDTFGFMNHRQCDGCGTYLAGDRSACVGLTDTHRKA